MSFAITKELVEQAAQSMRDIAPDFVPSVSLILGSGMGQAADSIEEIAAISYEDVPGMEPSTVPGHAGRFVLGKLGGQNVVCMQGRIHAYEGYTAQQLAFPVFIMHELGASSLIVTNAAGGINFDYGVGDLMLLSDIINFQFRNPCVGLSDEFGPRFFDMTHAFCPNLRDLAHKVAARKDIKVHEGVYISDLGPSFETPAEIRAFRAMGADAVGMSTAMETIAANHLGMKVLGISLISNPAAGNIDEPLSIEDVAKAARKGADSMLKLIEGVLEEM